jgi:hypothetical protein
MVQQELCEDGAMRVWLRLRYRNTGAEPIILGKYSASYQRYAISRDEEAARKGHKERAVDILLNSFTLNPTRSRTPPSERFVILKSGEFYELDTKAIQISYLYLNSDEVQRFRKGNHVLQVTVSTWDEPVALAQELSVIWRASGVLWWQGVTSKPMPFKIEKPVSTIKCS